MSEIARLAAAIAAIALLSPALAHGQTRREAESHVHGAADISFVVSGNQLLVTLDSPLENILGFEHAPQTAAERKTADAAQVLLNDPARIVLPAAAAQCAAAKPSNALPFENASDDHDHDHDNAHSDVEASYAFTCRNIAALDRIDVTAFKTFSGLKSVEAVYLGRTQFSRQLSPSSPILRLR